MVNSKNKGSTFERTCAKILSSRFEKVYVIPTAFRRNIDSGSFFGASNQKRISTHNLEKAEFGDIVTPTNFKYSVECKFYATPPSYNMFLKQECKMLDEWIKKAEQDSKNAGKKMLIIMKFNGVQEAVLIDELFGDLSSVINYKRYYILPLEDFLRQEDNHFIN